MPRYCAVKGCRNRGGTTSRLNHKKISFYPFPLQDKSRLQKWVGNLNRRGWTPSRHQYLCSEHFTENCFDIRWGIRTPLILSNSWKPAQRKDAAEPSETGELPLVLGTGIIFQTEPPEENARMLAGSDPKQHPYNKLTPELEADSAVAELCYDADAIALTDTAATFFEENSAVCFSEERAPSNRHRILVDEHSYCRAADTDRDQLWCKVLCLNAKILELGRREQSTVAKIQALENEITLLQRDANRRL
ncbi:hypothetical protein OJAV_G00221470 [Oryzias javanicus]|uniref:THAP domain-containing protein 5 n=1 Tax=Oryzias javanicus TaxID=123683 RepID=A0A437C265_ORYJA|nr:hypothetical protein OJAV_G00221470 [Oryzias javanicus]